MAQRYRSTPRGTFPTSSPLSSQAPLGYSEILRTLGPYSAGPMAERAARDAVAERDAAMASGRGATLRDAILGQTLNSPTGANRMRAAAMGASPMELAKLMPQRGGMDPQTAAGMQGITESARGIRGGTVGSVNGETYVVPAAGKANRDAFRSDVSGLQLNPNGPVSADAVTWKQYKKDAASQFATRGKEKRAQGYALDQIKAKGDSDARVADITAGGKVEAAEAAAGAKRGKEEQGLLKQLGASRARFKAEFENKVNAIRKEVDIDFAHQRKDVGTAEWKAEVQKRLRARSLVNAEEYVQRRAKDTYEGALGTTEDSTWKQEDANKFFPGLFDLGRAGLTPPTQLPQNAPPQSPMRNNGISQPRPQFGMAPQMQTGVGAAMGSVVGEAAPPPPAASAPQPPMPTAADAQNLNRILQQQEQQQVVGDSIEAGMGAQRGVMEEMGAQQMGQGAASALGAATSPAAYAQFSASHPMDYSEIRAAKSSYELLDAINGMSSDLQKLPPNSILALEMQRSIDAAKQHAIQLSSAGL